MEDKDKKSLEEENKENIKESKEKDFKEKPFEEKKEKIKEKEKQEKDVEKNKTLIEKSRENPWIVATIILGIVVLILILISAFGKGITGDVISSENAGEKLTSFIQNSGTEVTLVKIDSFNEYLYKATLSFEGEEDEVFITKDGEYVVPGFQFLIPLSQTSQENQTENENQQESGYSEQDLMQLIDFNKCLADAGVRIYGANWCGYTQQVIDILGGTDAMGDVYVECTENQELCSEEEITGYPTIKINGEKENIQRTLQGFADAAGCVVPELGGDIETNSATASC